MKLLRRLWFWIRRRQLERDFEEEARLHLDLKTGNAIAQGLTENEARRAARLEFGNPTLARERSRQSWGFPLLESILQDLRYSIRQLRKNAGFSAVAISTLALGIGANSAIFSVINAVLLRPLPYRDSNQLVTVGSDTKEADDGISYQHYLAWKTASRSFEEIAVYYRDSGWSRVTLTGDNPESAQGTYASASFFQVMGVAPVIGRAFTSQEESQKQRVAILGDGLWKRRFGGSRDVLGKTLQINGEDFQVIGVMPETFQFPGRDVEFWAPITTNLYWSKPPGHDSVHGTGADGFHWRWIAVARLRPGISPENARSELDGISRQWRDDPALRLHSTTVVPLHIEIAPGEHLALYVLFASVGLVLLIACSNVANLVLARGASRASEMALRTALGAPRGRLIRQLLTESAVLAAIAGCLGLLIAHYGQRALVAFAPADIPRLEQAGVDNTVLAFTLAISLLAAILFGLAPAIRTSRNHPAETLQSAGYGRIGIASRNRLSAILVAGEFALSVVLLAAAGLLVRSFIRLQNVDPGFRPDHVLTLHVRLLANDPFNRHDQLLQRLQQIPGVKAAAAMDELLPQHDPDGFGVRAVEGKDIEVWGKWTAPLAWTVVSGDVLGALGVPLLKGRYFSSQDLPDSPPVVLVDETMARRYWPHQDPIGQHLKGWDPRGHCTADACRDEWVTVIGVVPDMRRRGREWQPISDIFQWYRQSLPGNAPPGDFVVRTALEPSQLAPALRSAVREIDKTAVISGIATMETRLNEQVGPRRFQTWLLTLFALLALLLAGTGVYSVMHYVVARRTQEMGIRIALGAQARDVFWLVLAQGLRLAVAGFGAGLVAALVVLRVLESLLFGVRATDPVTFLAVVAVLFVTTIMACYIPARIATKVDPMESLRCT